MGILIALGSGFGAGLVSKTEFQTAFFLSLLSNLASMFIEAFKRVTGIRKTYFYKDWRLK